MVTVGVGIAQQQEVPICPMHLGQGAKWCGLRGTDAGIDHQDAAASVDHAPVADAAEHGQHTERHFLRRQLIHARTCLSASQLCRRATVWLSPVNSRV